MPPLLSPVIIWTAGLIGAYALIKLVRREHQRVNEELERVRAGVTKRNAQNQYPTLRRDQDGVYRP